jgi:hypothetical protein
MPLSGAQIPQIYSTPYPSAFPSPPTTQKEEIFHIFKFKIIIDQTIDKIKCKRNSMKTHQVLLNACDVNIQTEGKEAIKRNKIECREN